MATFESSHDEDAEPTQFNAPSHPYQKPKHSLKTIWILLVLLGLQNVAIKLMNLPLNRVIELRYCREYYSDHDPAVIGPDGNIAESLCKIDGIQQRLAWTQGMIETLHILCDLTVTIPMASMSDSGKRRLVLACNVIGLALMYFWIVLVGYLGDSFGVRTMLFGPLFTLIGGGECVFLSNISAIITEISAHDAQRATYFAYMSSVSYVIALLSPAVSAFIMQWNLWLPFWIGLAMLLLALPAISSLPTRERSALLPPDALLESESLLARNSIDLKRNQHRHSQLGLLGRSRNLCMKLWHQIAGRSNFRFLLGVFLIASLASSNTPILPQYISKRYGWTFAEAGYLLSVKATVNIVLLTLIVPNLIKGLLSRSRLSGVSINLYGAKISLLVSVFGALLIAISMSIWMLLFSFVIYAVGSALPVFTLSLVKSPAVAEDDCGDIAQDYSIVMMAKTIGSLCGLPLMTVAWAKGIGIGGAALGAPYFLSAAFYVLAYFCLRKLQLG